MRPDRSIAPSMATLTPRAVTRKATRFTLDYGTWRPHLAASGSRCEPAQTAEPRIIRLDPTRYASASRETEQRPA